MRALLALLCVLIVTGCAVFEQVPPNSAESRYFLALTPESLGRNLSLSQLVTGEYEDNTYRARYEVEIVGNRLTIVALSPLGITLFTLKQTGSTVTLDSALQGADSFDSRYTLFDFYLTYWPPDVLRRALKQNGLTLDIDAQSKSRIVRDADGKTVATVTYPRGKDTAGVTVITHVKPPYRLRISPLNVPVQR